MAKVYHQLPLFVPLKVCPACNPPTEKRIDEFARDSSRPDKHAVYCKVCQYAKIRAIQSNNEAHRERKNTYDRRYYETHIEESIERKRKWYKDNPLKNAEHFMRRKARKKAATVGEVSYNCILERGGYTCYICSQIIDPTIKKGDGKLVFDHVIPLARGGTHCEDNIKPTHYVCNSRKGTRLLEEMTPHQRRGIS